MQGDHRLRARPRSHDLLYLVLSHLVLSQRNIVAEQSSAELVSDHNCNCRPPRHSKDHIKRDAQSPDSSKLVVPAQVVEGSGTNCQAVEGHAKGNVARVLLLRLGQQVLVGLVLKLGPLGHCTPSYHFNKLCLFRF